MERSHKEKGPVKRPTLRPDFPDVPQNPGSALQPKPEPTARPDKVARTTDETAASDN
jgi:hypothetical protein